MVQRIVRRGSIVLVRYPFTDLREVWPTHTSYLQRHLSALRDLGGKVNIHTGRKDRYPKEIM